MRPCNLAEDRTVNAYLGDATFQWDGTNGDVMLEVPMTYTGRWFETDADGVKWEYRAVSSAQIGHLHLDHLFISITTAMTEAHMPTRYTLAHISKSDM